MEITSINNEAIREVKSLFKKRDRYKKNLYIIEGMKMVKEALENKYPLEDIYYSEGLLDIKDGPSLYHQLNKMDKAIKVSEEVFSYISDTETPQGVIATAGFKLNSIKDIDANKMDRLIFLDGLQDPGNMGTIIRSLDAFNLDGLIVNKGTVDPYNSKVVRATMGSIFRVPIYLVGSLEEDICVLKDKGYKILVTRLDGSKDIREVDFKKSVIVIGNESAGASEEISAYGDEFIKINMPGKSESLNAGVAGSIIMYEAGKP